MSGLTADAKTLIDHARADTQVCGDVCADTSKVQGEADG